MNDPILGDGYKIDPTTDITAQDIKSAYTMYREPFLANSYVLFDNFKPSSGCIANFKSEENGEHSGCVFDPLNPSSSPNSGYLAFSMMEGHSPKLSLSRKDGIINFEKYPTLMRIMDKMSNSLRLLETYGAKNKTFESDCRDYDPKAQLTVAGDDQVKQKHIYCENLDRERKAIQPIAKVAEKYYTDLLVFKARLGGVNVPEWEALLMRSSD